MADQWTHDRPFRSPTRTKPARRHQEQQPRLELPVPMPGPRPEETEAQPANEPQRGASIIDFYV